MFPATGNKINNIPQPTEVFEVKINKHQAMKKWGEV
jgi:hypothetical protein